MTNPPSLKSKIIEAVVLTALVGLTRKVVDWGWQKVVENKKEKETVTEITEEDIIEEKENESRI